ncbi:MAG: type II secretion system protein GspG [Candidatus Omnitrophica bacterium]|nr:type II secretion system protein GspG [Candidatus Omnitrophota bacterium]
MKKSFTLIELIVVIAIIAILAAIIAPNAFKAIEKAKVAKAIADFKAMKTACGSLYADTGKWPHGGDSEGRVIESHLIRNPTRAWPSTTPPDLTGDWPGWDGPYLDQKSGVHPWGGIYTFTTNTNRRRQPTDPAGDIELCVEFEDYCYPDGPNNCSLPLASAKRIDAVIDDGNVTTGYFQHPGGTDAVWVMQWDFCSTYSCW